MFEYLQASGEDWLHEVIDLYRERQPFVIATTPEGKEIVTADGSSGSCPSGIVAEAQSLLDSAGPANFSNGIFMDPVRPSSFNVAIFGAGEEIHLEYQAVGSAVPEGWRRLFVLESNGWCKDMDLYTRDGNTVDPLPSAGLDPGPREHLHASYNTRYLSGRE